jgi:hypothetical protein
MCQERIEEQVRGYFGPAAQLALGAALSEVRECFSSPQWLAGVLREMGPAVPAEDAVVRWAIRRGQLWA